jgi:hypothetical protein
LVIHMSLPELRAVDLPVVWDFICAFTDWW